MTGVQVTPTATNYRLLTYAGNNNDTGAAKFDFNLIQGKRLIIKKIALKWYTKDGTEGVPYLGSNAGLDGLISGHSVINSTTQKILIPENSAAAVFQDDLATFSLGVNNKPVFLNGKLETLHINEDNIDIRINEPIQSIIVRIAGAKAALLSGGDIVLSENLAWVCELGVYII